MTKTIKECCGERCKFTTSFRSPVARVVLCGREITPEEIGRAKEAYCRATETRHAAHDKGDSK